VGAFTFQDPALLALLALLPLVLWARRRRGRPVFVVPFAADWVGREVPARSRLPEWLVALGIALLIGALARPQWVEERRQVHAQGYDIVLAVDLSGSMLAEDFERGGQRANRLQAIKPVIDAFTARRPSDRIGVVVFAGRAYTLAPLSFDHEWLRRQIARLEVQLIEDGTAVGDALGLAVSRLSQVDRIEEGRRLGGFVILLTDGANNAGSIAPLAAARIASARGIPVYTIGAGREGPAPIPYFDSEGRKIGYRTQVASLDEETLREIAAVSGAEYFRAEDADTVDAAFAAIDRERKIEFDAQARLEAEELFARLALPGLALCAAGAVWGRPRGEDAA